MIKICNGIIIFDMEYISNFLDINNYDICDNTFKHKFSDYKIYVYFTIINKEFKPLYHLYKNNKKLKTSLDIKNINRLITIKYLLNGGN